MSKNYVKRMFFRRMERVEVKSCQHAYVHGIVLSCFVYIHELRHESLTFPCLVVFDARNPLAVDWWPLTGGLRWGTPEVGDVLSRLEKQVDPTCHEQLISPSEECLAGIETGN